MWLRHFKHLEDTARYKEFQKRYESFHKDDVVLLCRTCHRLIHDIYYIIICYEVQARPFLVSEWKWVWADKLMRKLRVCCDIWLHAKSIADT